MTKTPETQPNSGSVELIVRNIDHRLAQLGKNDIWLAKEAGLNRGFMSDLRRGRANNPSRATLEKLAAALGIGLGSLVVLDLANAESAAVKPERDGSRNPLAPGQPISQNTSVPGANLRHADRQVMGDGRAEHVIPVYGTAQCGPDGVFEMNTGEAINFVASPPRIENLAGVYAIYAEGDSMLPVYRHGELIFVTSKLRPYAGRDAVIELRPEGEQDDRPARALLKRILTVNSEFVEVQQFNPPLTWKIEMRLISGLHRVLETNDLY